MPEQLKSWQDFDLASHRVGQALGIFPIDSQMCDYKGIFWTHNHLGSMLMGVVDSMVKVGALERNSDDQFRWVDGFKVTSTGYSSPALKDVHPPMKDGDSN